MKKLLSIILLALPVTVMAGNFTGNEIRILSEEWKADKDGKFSTITTGSHIRVKPFYNSGIDVEKFEMGTAGSGLDHFWSIDFHMDGVDNIELIFTNPEVSYPYYQYDTDLGFHFHDVDDTWRPIVGVTVSTPFAPNGFEPSLIRFDENNIYVNLKGSSCVNRACENVSSPTGFNNIITINVQFEGDPNVYRAEEIDLLFDWLENNYPRYLPWHRESFYRGGNRMRYYQSNFGFLYVKDRHVAFSNGGPLMAFKDPHFNFYTNGNTLHFGSIDYGLHVSGIAARESRKRDARREEKARQEKEAREERARWELARQEKPWDYDPHNEEDDSYTEELF